LAAGDEIGKPYRTQLYVLANCYGLQLIVIVVLPSEPFDVAVTVAMAPKLLGAV
jgi:hypothetical protein